MYSIVKQNINKKRKFSEMNNETNRCKRFKPNETQQKQTVSTNTINSMSYYMDNEQPNNKHSMMNDFINKQFDNYQKTYNIHRYEKCLFDETREYDLDKLKEALQNATISKNHFTHKCTQKIGQQTTECYMYVDFYSIIESMIYKNKIINLIGDKFHHKFIVNTKFPYAQAIVPFITYFHKTKNYSEVLKYTNQAITKYHQNMKLVQSISNELHNTKNKTQHKTYHLYMIHLPVEVRLQRIEALYYTQQHYMMINELQECFEWCYAPEHFHRYYSLVCLLMTTHNQPKIALACLVRSMNFKVTSEGILLLKRFILNYIDNVDIYNMGNIIFKTIQEKFVAQFNLDYPMKISEVIPVDFWDRFYPKQIEIIEKEFKTDTTYEDNIKKYSPQEATFIQTYLKQRKRNQFDAPIGYDTLDVKTKKPHTKGCKTYVRCVCKDNKFNECMTNIIDKFNIHCSLTNEKKRIVPSHINNELFDCYQTLVEITATEKSSVRLCGQMHGSNELKKLMNMLKRDNDLYIDLIQRHNSNPK